MIAVSGLSKRYGDNVVFDALSLSVPAGTTCLTGPSGSGKTTLARILAGLEDADSGTVSGLCGSVVYLFQEPRLLPWANALDNIILAAPDLRAREAGGETVLISVQQSDDCGDCPEVRVPAPPSTADEQFPAYYTYDIAVQADGYYRERSADVPVFEGVVSVQSFDLIPLPAGHDDPYASGLTYYNSMPQP